MGGNINFFIFDKKNILITKSHMSCAKNLIVMNSIISIKKKKKDKLDYIQVLALIH